MRFYIIAGEPSGDLHAASLMKAIREINPDANFRGIGGDMMQKQGLDLFKHNGSMAYMGFWEVAKNIRSILGDLSKCKEDLKSYQPDAVILIDYPGFNLRMAEAAKKAGYKVIYYISPQIWAWNSGRVKKIRQYVDRMITILPFEKGFYAKHGVEVDYVGHPLLDVLDMDKAEAMHFDRPVIALLPGSRRQEVEKMLPIFLQATRDLSDFRVCIAGMSKFEESWYRGLMADSSADLIIDRTYDLLLTAHTALVTSGTATLETALLGTPQVVAYKGSSISYAIGKRLVNVDHISLVNLILEKECVPELIQDEANISSIRAALSNILIGKERSQQLSDYKKLRLKLGEPGVAARAARVILDRAGS